MQKLQNIFTIGWLLFIRDFQYRFSLTYLGYIWAFVRPLIIILPLILVGKQFNFGTSNQNIVYEVYSFVGFILWQIFFDSFFIPQWFIRRVRKIVQKIAFPYESIIFASCFYILFNLFIYLLEMILLFLLFKVHIQPFIILGILSIPLIIIAGLSIGIFISPITFVYLDFRYGIPIISGLLLWITPILYVSPEKGLLHSINKFNPITYLINVPRSWLIGDVNNDVFIFLFCCFIFLGIFILSLKFYYRTMSIAIDWII